MRVFLEILTMISNNRGRKCSSNITIALVFILFLTIYSCNSDSQKNTPNTFVNNDEIQTKKVEFNKEDYSTKEIICDSIYNNKKYKLVVSDYSNKTNKYEDVHNSIFKFYKLKNGDFQEVYRDSIVKSFEEIRFLDFNNDNVKDILIENISDVRSNITYYLYLVDTLNDKLTKVKGFNQIKNPHFLPKYNLVDNEVMSGREWTSFYQIQKDTIYDFGYVIYKGMNSDGTIAEFEKEYQSTLKKVLKDKNYR